MMSKSKEAEVAYFSKLTDGAKYHAVHKPFTDPDCGGLLCDLGAIISLLPPPPARILDLGCGTGWTTLFYARAGFEVTGVDISSDMIEQARGQQREANIANARFETMDVEHAAFDAEFDAAIFYDSLHHAENPHQALSNVFRGLRPGGICITVEPGYRHARSAHSKLAADAYGVTERDMPSLKIIRLAKRAGFRCEKILPQMKHLHKFVFNHPKRRPILRALLAFPVTNALVIATCVLLFRYSYGTVVLRKPAGWSENSKQ